MNIMLSKEQLEKFKERLLEEKAKFESELANFAEKKSEGDYKTLYVDFGDEVDDNVEEYRQHEFNLSLEKKLEEGLKDVLDALQRIEDGTYGICEGTGKEIQLERLEAYPAARYCIEYADKK